MTGIDRIAEAFAAARADGRRAALMPYMMGGYPDPDTSLRIGEAYADAGAHLIELGVPFSDPLADGPVVHAAGAAALRAGVTVQDVLEAGRVLATRVPVVLMCYANPILARGVRRVVDALAGAGISGLIVPDLPFEESAELRELSERRGIALISMVAPTTSDERLARIGPGACGFVYTVSVTGTTGERAAVDGSLAGIVARVKAHTAAPVAVGFGISEPAHAAAAVDAGADGVIVGSRLVRAAGEESQPVDAVAGLVRAFSAALH